MDPLKTEIDLRPPEFIQAHRTHRLRLAAALFFITAAGAVFLCFTLTEGRIEKLNLELEGLQKISQTMAEQSALLEQLEVDIRMLEEKANLKAALQEQALPWSDYLNSIISALPEDFCLNTVNLNDRGQLNINGSGPAMPEIAAYSQALCRLSFIRDSAVSYIVLEPGGDYRFIINATLR